MSNKVYLGEDGFIHSDYIGDQTRETIDQIEKDHNALIDKLKQQKKSAKLLVDLTRMGKQDSGARKRAFEALNSMDYDKMALFGQSRFIKYVGNFIIKAAGKQNKILFFNTQDEAVGWLKA